jgi:hypothetical protein
LSPMNTPISGTKPGTASNASPVICTPKRSLRILPFR